MDDSNRREFGEMLENTFEIFDKQISKAKLEIYFDVLRRFELSDVKTAITAHLNNPESGRFVPKPADIILHIDGGTQTRALNAWTKVERAIRCVGHYPSVVFDDSLIHAVVADMGGWCKINAVSNKELPFLAKEFQNRYQGYSLRGQVPDYPRRLIGLEESHNEKSGFTSQPPVFIGYKPRALVVYEQGLKREKPAINRLKNLQALKTELEINQIVFKNLKRIA